MTNELVQTLGLSNKTPPGLPGLKQSSNSILPVAWIAMPATDLRLKVKLISLLPTAGEDHPICPVMLGDAQLASDMADDMLGKFGLNSFLSH